MELEVLREDLVFGTRTAGHAIAGKSSMPILSGILLRTLEGELELCATDLERAIRCRIPAQIKSQGEVVLHGQVLEQLVTRLPDEDRVLLAAADGKVRLSCGSATFELLTLPADEFPQLVVPEGEPLCRISRESFIQAIQQTAFAAVKATETTRLALTGVNMVLENGKIKLAATNGYRLAVREVPVEGLAGGESRNLLIDAQVMTDLMRVLGTVAPDEVHLHLGDGQAHFSAGPVVFTSRLIQEEFPDFERVIPRENDIGLFLPREEFLATLRRLEITAAEESGAVTLHALTSSNTLEVSSASREKGTGTERVRLVKPAPRGIEIAFKAEYLIDALRRMKSDQVVLWLSAPDRAGLLEPAGDIAPEDQGFIYVCMPVRLL
ncbi:DNA polymerase III subunit beta [Candidatus Bipolaricaulota sp. J31]